LNHRISGSGTPSALQFSVSGSFLGTVIDVGCSVMWGDREWPETERKNISFLPVQWSTGRGVEKVFKKHFGCNVGKDLVDNLLCFLR
jgi:hypothetical protein